MSLCKKQIALLIGCLLIAFHCGPLISQAPSELIEGNGSSVGPGIVHGTLYEPGGKAPAVGAVVVVRNKNATALFNAGQSGTTSGALLTTFTNKNGTFSFDTLASGLYVIEGSDVQGNMALFDSVRIATPTKQLILPPDTLEPAGAIRGALSLLSGGNPLQVFVLAFGVDRFCQVSPDGSFVFKGFAVGVYTIKIVSLDPAYGSADTSGIAVTSGDTTNIGTIELPLRKLPAPALRLEYDTMLMRAALSWHPLPASITKGYNVYSISGASGSRADSASFLKHPINNELVKDTMLLIDVGMWGTRMDSTYTYRVSMLDVTNNQGPLSNPASVTFSSTLKAYDSMQLSLPEDKPVINSISLNKHDEFVVELYRKNAALDYEFYINRYSRKGEQISSWRIPDSLYGYGKHFIYLMESANSADNLYFTTSLSYSGGWWSDSLFLITMLPTGDFLEPVPLPDSSNILGIAVVDAMAYVPVGREIKRMNLTTGASAPWKCCFCTYNTYLRPYSNHEVIVGQYCDDGKGLRVVCYDTSGVERFSIPQSYNDLRDASGSLIVFKDRMYRIHASGELRLAVTTDSWDRAMIASDGTVFTQVNNNYGKLYMRRFPQ
jgi:hypothetical protein